MKFLKNLLQALKNPDLDPVVMKCKNLKEEKKEQDAEIDKIIAENKKPKEVIIDDKRN